MSLSKVTPLKKKVVKTPAKKVVKHTKKTTARLRPIGG
jgi:hypothetical protein